MERLILPVMDDEGILMSVGPNVKISDGVDLRYMLQELATSAPPNIVALEIEQVHSLDRQTEGEPQYFAWIDGEILPGKVLRHRFSDPSKSPPLSEIVVVARTGTIFSAGESDLVISSKPPTVAIPDR